MKNRKADVPYCGVREKKIKSAKPVLNEENFKHLYNFIVRRYLIHVRKDVKKLPAPWTKDPILREFKFTNVRREHDRETKWVIDRIVNNPKLSYENKLMNLALYRMFNKSTTMEIFDSVIDFEIDHGPNFDLWLDTVRDLFKLKLQKDPKYTFFTNAFLTCGIKVALGNQKDTNDEFMPMRIIKFAYKLWNEGFVDKIKKAKNQQEVFKVIQSWKGLGEFLAYQIYVDMTYIPEFPFSENEFTVSGPGCIKGLKEVFDDFDGMTYDEALFWLRDNIDYEFIKRAWKWEKDKLFVDLEPHDRHMNVMSLENCHCEISKYIRAHTGTGRPKNKYKAGSGNRKVEM
jgi:hypothetical protein